MGGPADIPVPAARGVGPGRGGGLGLPRLRGPAATGTAQSRLGSGQVRIVVLK